jgi:flagellin
MIINNNIPAMNTHRQLGINQNAMQNSMEKLSSGLRINKAADDAAGLAISEKMRAQINGLDQASRNAQDGISMIQTAEGALNETHDILQRMRELSVQAANDTLQPEDRDAIATEIGQLVEEIDRISETTQFNGKQLVDGTLGVSRDSGSLDSTTVGLSSLSDISVSGAKASETFEISHTAGVSMTLEDTNGNRQTIDLTRFTAGDTLKFDSLGVSIKTDSAFDNSAAAFEGLDVVTGTAAGATFQIGANEDQNLSITIGDMSSTGLNLNSFNVDSHENAKAAITTIENAIKDVSSQRSDLGAWQNRLDHTINNLNTSSENLSAAESRIRDVDMASEMMEMTRANILSQASQSMLAQANQQPQSVLQLLG